jgi:ADP-ribose pyrophosphatase YjhB (NUDIX family)
MSDELPGVPRHAFTKRLPAGDTRERMVCDTCGWIDYVNPKIVVGAVCTYGGRILMCRRAIEPRRGYWTIPAGYLEEHETTEDGARREAREEALAEIRLDRLLAVYNVPRLSQVQLIYRAVLERAEFGVGEESLEVALFGWDEVPWDDIAFPTVHWALEHHRSVEGRIDFAPFSNPAGEVGDRLRDRPFRET